MKKIVITNGLISGAIVATLMIVSVAFCYIKGTIEGSMLIGYASMLLAFSLIFVAIKNYRDKYNNGIISFGTAFKIGLLISLIASTIYVATWAVTYNFFMPDFMDRYATQMLDQLKSSNASQAEYNSKVLEMDGYKQMYKNPLLFVLLTYAEILPVALIVTLISSLLLKRKNKQQLQGVI